MPDFSYGLYDTIPLGTAADTTHTLFQVAQGADATHTKQFTNMRAAGQIPQNERLLIRRIYTTMWGTVVEADIPLLYDGNYLEFKISDELILQVPLVMTAYNNAYSGVITQGTAADGVNIGRMGLGYMFEPNVMLQGGDSFRVDVFQDNALSAAENMWLILEGVLTR